ncbi:dimethyl sulfoxide reductase anchor subunit family protein [Slackia piriformis]|uniref:dimethyl sulfoxide reductase anchor subunit family protein n=1 Tax=Slackia piriformis TaxID=626934 RepID=UPI0026DB0B6F|nr:DmsC/YnfH family molybdoenzyme membrane anchor subunit [Slackia piriformis]MDO5024769.1 dimethyl sulfoxide reductase anchor subunit [Slackia piriformis]
MGTGFSETPLAVFTTLAPMGAGAFLVLACLIAAAKLDDEALARLDRLSIVPFAVSAVGFIGAFFHLANPLHAFGVFAGIGTSPLSNEVAVGVVFMAAALVYVVLAFTAKLTASSRKAFSLVVGVLALVFMVFCGLAYMMDTIPTWNTPASIVQMLGYGLLGGSAFAALTCGLARIEVSQKASVAVIAFVAVGLVLSLVGFGIQITAAASIANIWGAAIDLVPAIWGMFAVLAVCGIVALALIVAGGKKNFPLAFSAAACALVVVGVFLARIGFYGLYMSVAL